jgi:predicted nucleic acid-binding protein
VIVLDASVLIALLDDRDALHTTAVDLLIEHADEPFGCSSITIAEALVAPARTGRLDAARQAIATLGVAEIRLPEDGAPRLAQLRADSGLTLPECCVLLAAEDAGARIVTLNDRLARAAAGLASP